MMRAQRFCPNQLVLSEVLVYDSTSYTPYRSKE